MLDNTVELFTDAMLETYSVECVSFLSPLSSLVKNKIIPPIIMVAITA